MHDHHTLLTFSEFKQAHPHYCIAPCVPMTCRYTDCMQTSIHTCLHSTASMHMPHTRDISFRFIHCLDDLPTSCMRYQLSFRSSNPLTGRTDRCACIYFRRVCLLILHSCSFRGPMVLIFNCTLLQTSKAYQPYATDVIKLYIRPARVPFANYDSSSTGHDACQSTWPCNSYNATHPPQRWHPAISLYG